MCVSWLRHAYCSLGYGPCASKTCSASKDRLNIVDKKKFFYKILDLMLFQGHSDWVNDVVLTDDNKWIVSVGKVS